MSAWEGSRRKEELPKDWQQRRLKILRRDRFECQAIEGAGFCGDRASDVDHIKRGNDHSPENLQSLCRWHHLRKSSKEGLEAKMAAKAEAEKAKKMAHPGMQIKEPK